MDNNVLKVLQQNLNAKAIAFLRANEEISSKGRHDISRYKLIKTEWEIATQEYMNYLNDASRTADSRAWDSIVVAPAIP